jgi:hypothetical protein
MASRFVEAERPLQAAYRTSEPVALDHEVVADLADQLDRSIICVIRIHKFLGRNSL